MTPCSHHIFLVTEDMVKNGTVTVERAQYNSIIIPANLKADVLLKTVKADEVVVEGGADYTVTLYRCDIDKLDVTAPEVKVMTIAELNAALNAEDADTEAVIAQFQEDFAAKKAAEAAQVELVTTYFTTVKELNVKASAKIDTNDCEVDQINLAVADVEERMNVEVEEFNGAMSADLDRAEGAFAALFMLDLEDSKLSALDVTGADSSCFIEGKASVVDAINVADAANVTLNAATGKIVVGEKATGAKVRVYSDVNEVVVKGDANSIVLPTCAEIGNAVVEGNNVKIYGYGELESAVITGTGANVAVYGTAVEGDNDSTPPAAMIAMNPYKNLTKNERPSAPSEPEAVYTFTYEDYAAVKAENADAAPYYQFELKNFGLSEFEAKDKVKVTVTLNSSGTYHANFGANVWDGSEYGKWNNVVNQSGSGKVVLEGTYELPHAQSWINAQVQIWYMADNSADIEIESIVVEKLESEIEEQGPIHTYEYVEVDGNFGNPKYSFCIKDYLGEVTKTDKVKITLTFSSDSWFGGEVAGNSYNAETDTNDWVKSPQFSNDNPTAEIIIIDPWNGGGSIDVTLYWMDSAAEYVNIDSIEMEIVTE